MEKQRQSNFELLRIILMIAIPLYHMMIYNNIIYSQYNQFTAIGLLFCSGSAIVADYAFMALSSFFLQESKDRPILAKFLTLFAQVLFIYFIKHITLSEILGLQKEDYFLSSFFYKGSWWFIYVYFIILLIYPILNKIIFTMKNISLLLLCSILGVIFIYNGISNHVTVINDLLGFLFTYFVVGYLRKKDFKKFLVVKSSPNYMILIYIIGFLVTFLISLFIKLPISGIDNTFTTSIIQHLIGKYSIIQFVMGIAVFLAFRSFNLKHNMVINSIAKNVFYVFLLHETVMAVFWHFNKLRPNGDSLPYNSMSNFLFWCFMYIGTCFMVAIVVRKIYEILLKPFVSKWIERLCGITCIQAFENWYKRLID